MNSQVYSSNDEQQLCVDKMIMSYISEIYAEQLANLADDCGVRIIKREESGVLKLNFVPERQKSGINVYQARERFITFYQQIATNLELKRTDLTSLEICTSIRKMFPKILFMVDHDMLVLMGPPVHVMEACKILSQGFRQTSRRDVQSSSTAAFHASASSLHRSQPLQNERNGFQACKQNSSLEDSMCPICLDKIDQLNKETLQQCKHSFCKNCIKESFKLKPACPVCGVMYGKLTGNQPKNGHVTIDTKVYSLPGYESYNTIMLTYYIPDGIQGPEHPKPGKPYRGTIRTAYLPDCPEGKKVLELLQKAFNQGLIFTIGKSVTTGEEDVVTWNDIHHKTHRTGGPTRYGYPDPDYLKRVQEELKAKGIA
ncbi:probable E3 ubiquitin-protein ligase DTX3 isoform X2 [Protopterus annectens]|nr:probable E3 ubiquitin-protein ligase DTX3 isoform X2 [Protopterus annectens]